MTRQAPNLSQNVAAIPVRDGGGHPRFFVDEPGLVSPPVCRGASAGRVQAGGSCNADQISFVPHCHGTHTEGVGHITPDRQAIQDHMPEGMLMAHGGQCPDLSQAARTADKFRCFLPARELDWPSGTEALIGVFGPCQTIPGQMCPRLQPRTALPLAPVLTP